MSETIRPSAPLWQYLSSRNVRRSKNAPSTRNPVMRSGFSIAVVGREAVPLEALERYLKVDITFIIMYVTFASDHYSGH